MMRPSRLFVASLGLTAAILPVSACSHATPSPPDRETSTRSTTSSHRTLLTPGAPVPATSHTSSSATRSSGLPEPQTQAMGRQTRVTFDLPPNFAVFDRDALQDRVSLEQMARITGASPESLRTSDPRVDLQALWPCTRTTVERRTSSLLPATARPSPVSPPRGAPSPRPGRCGRAIAARTHRPDRSPSSPRTRWSARGRSCSTRTSSPAVAVRRTFT